MANVKILAMSCAHPFLIQNYYSIYQQWYVEYLCRQKSIIWGTYKQDHFWGKPDHWPSLWTMRYLTKNLVWNPWYRKIMDTLENVQRKANELIPMINKLLYEDCLKSLGDYHPCTTDCNMHMRSIPIGRFHSIPVGQFHSIPVGQFQFHIKFINFNCINFNSVFYSEYLLGI